MTTRHAQRGAQTPRSLSETPGPDPSTPLADVRLVVGRLGGTHGVRGALKMRVLTDDPEHLTTLSHVYLGDRDTPVRLESIGVTPKGAIIKLAGFDSPDAAAKLSGLEVKISGEDARPLEEGEYFLFQLIGLRAEDESGRQLGTVLDLIETGAHDVLVIGSRPNAPDVMMVPNHPEFVPEIDPELGRIVVRPLDFGDSR